MFDDKKENTFSAAQSKGIHLEVQDLGAPIWEESQRIAKAYVSVHGTDEKSCQIALEKAADYLNDEFNRRIDEAADGFEKVKMSLAKSMYFKFWKEIMNRH